MQVSSDDGGWLVQACPDAAAERKACKYREMMGADVSVSRRSSSSSGTGCLTNKYQLSRGPRNKNNLYLRLNIDSH